jgi:hypothetical protein
MPIHVAINALATKNAEKSINGLIGLSLSILRIIQNKEKINLDKKANDVCV